MTVNLNDLVEEKILNPIYEAKLTESTSRNPKEIKWNITSDLAKKIICDYGIKKLEPEKSFNMLEEKKKEYKEKRNKKILEKFPFQEGDIVYLIASEQINNFTRSLLDDLLEFKINSIEIRDGTMTQSSIQLHKNIAKTYKSLQADTLFIVRKEDLDTLYHKKE